ERCAHLEAQLQRYARYKLELIPARYAWHPTEFLIQLAGPVAEPERVRIVQQVRAGVHVTGSVDDPLDSPSTEHESSSRQPGRYGCLEAVISIRAGAVAAVSLIHLRLHPEIGELQIINRQRRAIQRIDDRVRRPGRGWDCIVERQDLLIIRAAIPVEVQSHAPSEFVLNARAVLQFVFAAEIGIERPVLQDSKQGVGIGANIPLAEAGSGRVTTAGLARGCWSTDPGDVHGG